MEEIRVAQPELPGTGSFISLERGDILKVREADILVVSAFAEIKRRLAAP